MSLPENKSNELVPRMSSDEINLLRSYLGIIQGNYWGFGCGGSDFIACRDGKHLTSITSIDSSQEWIDKVKSNDLIKQFVDQEKINFIYVDINGDEKSWGRPKDRSKVVNWSKYSSSIRDSGKLYSLVLIDGRFRVACALNTLYAIDGNSIVLFHDYNDRPHYHCIEEFYEILFSVDSMVVLRRKEVWDQDNVQKLLSKYQYVCE
jgi:hypothetical protein